VRVGTLYPPVIFRVCGAPGTPQAGTALSRLGWVVDNSRTTAADICDGMKPARAPSRTITRAAVRSLLAIAVFALMAMCEPGWAEAQGPVALPIDTPTSSATQPTCASPGPGKPIFITADCVDPRFNDPYIIEDTTVPAANSTVQGVSVPYTYIHGGFRGTDATFSIYFPPASMYQGRFFQLNVHQLRTTGDSATVALPPQVLEQAQSNTPSNASAATVFFQENEVGYAFNTGGYLVETSPNSEAALTARDALSGKFDPSVEYRVGAAAAKFSRVMAGQIYGTNKRPFGYLSGGSGGSIMTITAAENTSGVWDGFVPYVMGERDSIPSHFGAPLFALRVLSKRPFTLPCIADAFEPGGSGDPDTSCHLTREESEAFREISLFGYPKRSWFDWQALKTNGNLLFLTADYVPLMDPTYVNDFWTKPGYLGHDDPSGDLKRARIQYNTTVRAVTPASPEPAGNGEFPAELLSGPAYNAYEGGQYIVGLPPRAFVLDGLPDGDLTGAEVIITSGPGQGKRFPMMVVDKNTNTIAAGGNSDPKAVSSLQAGDTVRIDNSFALAVETYHRHQVPPAADHEYTWDQFRDSSGRPTYPQRDVLVGPTAFRNSAGAPDFTGKIHGKMIVMNTLLDTDAYPWGADWYRRFRLDPALPAGTKESDQFRLWFTDNANHTSLVDAHRVSYVGVLQQALRDVSAWVEKGVPPAPSTNYKMVDDQVVLPPTAAERRGIQPVVKLTADGGVTAQAATGQPVTLTATIEVPPGTGKVVNAEWDFNGTGDFQSADCPQCNGTQEKVTLTTTHAYSQPGTFFAALRVTSQRDGDTNTASNQVNSYAFIFNLGRARVVVH
jgi:PKD domain